MFFVDFADSVSQRECAMGSNDRHDAIRGSRAFENQELRGHYARTRRQSVNHGSHAIRPPIAADIAGSGKGPRRFQSRNWSLPKTEV
jgi:hypothetical protein